ncbi:MAG: hypothetical protein P5702_20215 [Limnospira sp. PMC 1291.21]|uniref:Uncharacterized protein n=2 Tax=Limnospira TaxID=2596745 RepID=A0A9P1KIZ5_9CYAN|nr:MULTISPECIES: hypothetical protein [Limnospira]MDT9276975.1 hypothetical protein [Limnospira sp. PMC 737.11]MDY7051193.1 hypothetical protein [Limnospira fusiformis LS22]RAQ43849.1 hypothetical protein B9S53_10375 [Arthrospira sp. O9.13F]MDT9179977.1 hypothetical protein [Limnospira sp. PMC 1238.20]MDT9190183.1 hypothetical protein [Limnospira sp. PMC 894.15]
MTKTLSWAGLLGLSCGLLACGQLTTGQTTEQTIRPSSESFLPQNAAIASSPVTVSSPSGLASRHYNAEAIYTEFERLTRRACQQQEKIVGNLRYQLCTMTDSQGLIQVVYASSSLASEGDGAGYWLNENADIYAIRYFHSDEVFVLLPEARQTIVELVGNRQINVTTDKARWHQLELDARKQIMEISAQFDLNNSTVSNQPTSDRQEIQPIALMFWQPGALAGAGLPTPTIEKMALNVTTDKARWHQLELDAREQIIEISAQFDLNNFTVSNQPTSDRQEIQRIALMFLEPGALAAGLPTPTIEKMAIADDTALLTWQQGETAGMMLLRKEQGQWGVLTYGGGAIDATTLSEYNVPQTTGEALLKQLNLN